jgi:glycosyltransferase involved in cell wall biosynthesis
MKVAIDAQALGTQGGGDETYMRNVIRGLAAVDPGGDYTLYFARPLPDLRIPGTERMRRVVVPHKLFRRTPVAIPLRAAREHIDVIHTQYASPPFSIVPVVVSIHDISYERYPQWFTHADLLHMRAFVGPTARRAAVVLTLSEFSKDNIVRRYCVPPDRVVVTHCAADPVFRPLHDAGRLAEVRDRYGTGEHYILCVGNLQPRKNLVTLIQAYVRLRQADATRHKLVLVGRKGWLYDDIFAAARDSGYADELVFTDYVPDEDLVALYNAAGLFVYPSLFEGFGIPPLEAMACGTPTITSNTSALPEVVGDAALTIDPLDVEELARAMRAVLDDNALQERLSARGLQRAATFSWEATARTILDVYHRVSRSG